MDKHKKASLIFLLLLIWMLFFEKILFKFIKYIFPVKFVVMLELNFSYQLIFIQVFVLLIFIVLYFIISKKSIKDTINIKKISSKNILLVFLISIFMQPIIMLINLMTSFFTDNVVGMQIANSSRYPLLQLILATAVFPPILEETIFRGILLKKYEKYSFWYGIILTSLFFGIMHLNLNQFFYTFFMGVVISILVKITGSIFAGILCHSIVNGTQAITGYVLTKYATSSVIEIINNNILLSIILVLSVIIFSICMYIFVKVNRDRIKNNKEKVKIFNIYFIIDILIFVCVIISQFL
ncbi:MAG: lysostaphin resistance A-like protein [Lachnospirales bacterium]